MFKNLKRNAYIAIPIVCSLFFTSCLSAPSKPAAYVDTSKLTANQWIEDIDYLQENLPKKHKNVYHSIKKEEFDKELGKLKSDVPRLKDYEIKMRLAEIVASVGDAHTSLYFKSNQDNDFPYPVGLWWFGNDLRVIMTDKQHKDLIGKKLISVNSIPVSEVIGKIDHVISHENDQWLKVMNVKYISFADMLKFINVTDGGKADFEFQDDKGDTKKLSMTPYRLTENNIIMASDLTNEKPITSQYYYTKDYGSQLYWYKYIPEDKILYFQYNQCIDRNTAKDKSLPDFDEFSNELIKTIKSKDIDKFVIDLRNNTGGNSTLMTKLASKLKKIDKVNKNGKIFVLIGRQTFSSGVMACMDLKNETNAVFYGEATGGNVNGYGDIKILILPNSQLQISYSTKYFKLSDNYKEGFTPDVNIEQSFDNYIKGVDEVYEAIKMK